MKADFEKWIRNECGEYPSYFALMDNGELENLNDFAEDYAEKENKNLAIQLETEKHMRQKDKEMIHRYAEFCVECDRNGMRLLIDYDDFIKQYKDES